MDSTAECRGQNQNLRTNQKNLLNLKREKNQHDKNWAEPQDLRYNDKTANICIIGVPEKEEGKKWVEKLPKDIVAENSPDLVKVKILRIREVWESYRE